MKPSPSVFQMAKSPKRSVRQQKFVDPTMIQVEHNTPIPDDIRVSGKYDDKFSALKPGSCLACERIEVEAIANALRKWMQRNKITGMKILKHSRCEDGKARLWLVKDENAV